MRLSGAFLGPCTLTLESARARGRALVSSEAIMTLESAYGWREPRIALHVWTGLESTDNAKIDLLSTEASVRTRHNYVVLAVDPTNHIVRVQTHKGM